MKKRSKFITISLFCTAFIIIALTATYAYYQSTIAGTVNGTIAAWSFTANNQTSTMNLDFGEFYPGKSGVYNLELSAEDSDLDVYYEFEIDYSYLIGRHLFFDSEYSKCITCTPTSYIGKYGIIPAGEKVTIPIYINWPYDGNDSEKYADGRVVSGDITIIGRQYTAYTGSIPLGLVGEYMYEEITSTSGYIIMAAPM